MKAYLLRRKKLGKTSCDAIANNSTTGIVVVRNDQDVPANKDLCIRWGTTSNVPHRQVLNTAKAIHTVSDKTGFRLVMDEFGLCPVTVTDDHNQNRITYPMIVRPSVHHQGRNLHVCRTQAEFNAATARCGEGWYASPFIDKVAEYRVFLAQGRVICVAKKTPADAQAVAWNVAQGGRFDNVRWDDWPLKAVRVSREAFLMSELDFGGVDVMVDREENCYVLEINSAPSLTSEYRQQCFTKVFDRICQTGHKEAISVMPDKGGYRKFIHPAVCDNAIVI